MSLTQQTPDTPHTFTGLITSPSQWARMHARTHSHTRKPTIVLLFCNCKKKKSPMFPKEWRKEGINWPQSRGSCCRVRWKCSSSAHMCHSNWQLQSCIRNPGNIDMNNEEKDEKKKPFGFRIVLLYAFMCVCVHFFNEYLLKCVPTSVSFLCGGLSYLWALGVADNRATFNDVQLGNGIRIMATVTLLAGLWCKRLGRSSWCCYCLKLLCCCRCCCCCRLIGGFCRLWSRRRVEWWFCWFCGYHVGARLQNQGQWQDPDIFT